MVTSFHYEESEVALLDSPAVFTILEKVFYFRGPCGDSDFGFDEIFAHFRSWNPWDYVDGLSSSVGEPL